MKFYIIDAFTESVFGGNPAGVVILPEGAGFPEKGIMLKTAAELRYSETAFIRRKNADSFHFRYFTPAEEVDLCGHATIASYFALLEEGLVKEGQSYQTETLAGEIRVIVEKGFAIMDMAPPEAMGVIDNQKNIDELYRVMGLPAPEKGIAPGGDRILYPEIISTGLPDILLPVTDRDALNAMEPDFKLLADLSKRYKVVGVHAFAPGKGLSLPAEEYTTEPGPADASGIADPSCAGTEASVSTGSTVTAYCRNFAPAVGIDEEAATGTSNGALTYYLYKNALIEGGIDCIYLQGEAMGRPSRILGRLSPDGRHVQIGGTGAILARGEIHI